MWQKLVRTFFDVLLAGVGLVILLPILVVVTFLILLASGWPIIYSDERVGLDGEVFNLLKFRTMRVDLTNHNPPITHHQDRRITRIGFFLRKYKLDELPQLINVVRGDMSIIGPRPERPEVVESYSATQRAILSFRPGLASPASLKFRNESVLLSESNWESVYMTQVLPAKLQMDLDYMKGRSLYTDLRMMLRSFWIVLTPFLSHVD